MAIQSSCQSPRNHPQNLDPELWCQCDPNLDFIESEAGRRQQHNLGNQR